LHLIHKSLIDYQVLEFTLPVQAGVIIGWEANDLPGKNIFFYTLILVCLQ